MGRYVLACVCVVLLQTALAVKVKVVMRSEEADSKIDDEETHTETWPRKTILPLKHKRGRAEEKVPGTRSTAVNRFEIEYEEEKASTTEKTHALHPNEMIFPLIYRQNHINSMFKYGENWYTWSTEKRSDGSKATHYYICYEEPKRCDDVGWERTDALPKCAFEIDSVMSEDRACINSFGIEPHAAGGGACDGAEQIKISDIVRACGPRIRSLWRFIRVGRRPANAAKPADVNSLICEDEEECYISLEYRIHHDRITFSLHEPARGQTFKSVLKRELEDTVTPAPEHPRTQKLKKVTRDEEPSQRKKFRIRTKAKASEGKGVIKERNDSEYGNRRTVKNKIKIREENSDEISEGS